MSRSELAQKTCTVARTVEMFGDEWTLMILREMFLGGRRFDDLQRQIGASPYTLSQRLKRMEGIGVIRRETYSERPPRHEYRLTDKGRDLWAVIVSMKIWGDKWLDDGETPVAIRHMNCGHIVVPQMCCPQCGEPMGSRDARVQLSSEFEKERIAAGGGSASNHTRHKRSNAKLD